MKSSRVNANQLPCEINLHQFAALAGTANMLAQTPADVAQMNKANSIFLSTPSRQFIRVGQHPKA